MSAASGGHDRQGSLRRHLGVGDAVVIGAGSMIGAGVFAAWAPAAGAAGGARVIGQALAAAVAFANAASSAQLAAIHPESGGTYVYGRRQLGDGWGHLAGWGFVVGKTASCAAMALTVGAYLWPQHERAVAIGAVAVITVVNIGGLSRTVAVTRMLLVVSLAALAAVVVAGWTGGQADIARIDLTEGDALGVLRSAGFLFFAFAGYARIATLGEEVRDPAVTIPKAVPRALLAVLIVYAIVAVTALAVVDSAALAATDAPLRLVGSGAPTGFSTVVRVGAGVAALGVLLNLIPGVSRTSMAMARNRELPGWFAHIDHNRDIPLRAELTVAGVVMALVVLLDLRNAIAVSGVAVLTYYAVTNAAALTLSPQQRRWPRSLAWFGLAGCVVLIFSLPPTAVVSGSAVLAAGVLARAVVARRSTSR
ncbi:MAG: APC family permease [Acidimicrobiales bacterium]